jgi:ComF family protein
MARVSIPGFDSLRGVPVIPVPTTRRRLRERGYNQAEVLASGVADASGSLLVHALFRRDGGESQVALHPEERRANVKGAFQLRDSEAKWIQGRDVVLVDDVLTTGATACSAAETLCEGGVRSVALLTFARALPG